MREPKYRNKLLSGFFVFVSKNSKQPSNALGEELRLLDAFILKNKSRILHFLGGTRSLYYLGMWTTPYLERIIGLISLMHEHQRKWETEGEREMGWCAHGNVPAK